ncbi:NUDIX hydrolase [Aquidulcibacter sp.]|uniref:NUDIX hydrolase n=1 Tax=Aquidulcibacter sp. TaxID=2052990 RepID=UPI0025BEAF16|nr:NUDIX hydrolase [Aquidulcibacter sp.]MCA3696937.1 NUDIX hydrolase [Aquidulcibacter sp.]
MPANFSLQIPAGEDRMRQVCDTCGFINYVNPKIVAGVVINDGQGRILLCRRAIEPRHGFWTVPAGFMEERETTAEGAAREAWEEAQAKVTINALLGIYEVPRISQVHFMYRGTLSEDSFAPGPESLEVAWFAYEDIPWDQMAFPTGVWALKDWAKVQGQAAFVPFSNPPGMEHMTHPRKADGD